MTLVAAEIESGDESQECHKSLRGSASQFFVAGELCRRNLVAVVTLGNCPNTDILCSDLHGKRFVHIQVKTFRPGDKKCSVGMKAEEPYSENFFWVLAGVPLPESQQPIDYFVIPAGEMAAHIKAIHQLYLATPGKKGQKHADSRIRVVRLPPRACIDGWNIESYRNNWKLIMDRLRW